jgi:GT2 family glycosyltransferase
MLVSVVVVNWNGARFLKNCLDSILIQSYTDLEVLIIDNASEDHSVQIVREGYPQLRLIENSENKGYCQGCNQGINSSSGSYVLILNPDTILTPDFIKNLVSAMELDPRIGMASGKLLRFDQTTLDTTGQFLRWNLTPLERGYGEKDEGQFDTPGYCFSTCGAAAFYRRAMLEDIKIKGEYFDSSFFAYYEDLDLGWRAQLFGWKCYYTPRALAFHYRGGGLRGQLPVTPCSSPRVVDKNPRTKNLLPRFSFFNKPSFLQRHILKNRYLTLLKNLGVKDFFLIFPSLFLFDPLIWIYLGLIQPGLLRILPELLRLLPETWEKRRIIQSRRVVSASYVRSFLRFH